MFDYSFLLKSETDEGAGGRGALGMPLEQVVLLVRIAVCSGIARSKILTVRHVVLIYGLKYGKKYES